MIRTLLAAFLLSVVPAYANGCLPVHEVLMNGTKDGSLGYSILKDGDKERAIKFIRQYDDKPWDLIVLVINNEEKLLIFFGVENELCKVTAIPKERVPFVLNDIFGAGA